MGVRFPYPSDIGKGRFYHGRDCWVITHEDAEIMRKRLKKGVRGAQLKFSFIEERKGGGKVGS